MSGSTCSANSDAVEIDHNFRSYVVATMPPTPEQIESSSLSDFTDADDTVKVLDGLTAKRYVVACSQCGLVIAGHVGMQPPEVVLEDGVPAGDAGQPGGLLSSRSGV